MEGEVGPTLKLVDSQLTLVHFLTQENPISFYEIPPIYLNNTNIFFLQNTLLFCSGAERENRRLASPAQPPPPSRRREHSTAPSSPVVQLFTPV